MMNRMTHWAAALACTALAWVGHVQAQTIESLAVEPARASVGQPVKLTTQFVVKDAINCKVRVHFGDGNYTDFMVNQPKDVPMVLEHAYTKPGKYAVRVEGRGATRCMGDGVNANVDVLPKGAVAAAVTRETGSVGNASVCPAGWALSKAGVHKKTGAFTCTAKPRTAVPEPRPACPGELTYFENTKKGQLGCKV